jgi:hypothetical protein
MWDEMYAKLRASGVKIRGIWIADVAHQGQSSVLNENKLGNDRKFVATVVRFRLY